MGKFIGIGAGAVVGKDGQVEGLGSLVQVEEKRRRTTPDIFADIFADKAISDPKVGKEWCQRTNRAVFTWRKPCREAGKVTYQDRYSTFNNCVRDAIRRGAAENEVPKHVEKLTGS